MKEIWVPYKNRDMTEGRGPMIPEPIAFDDEELGWKYVDTKCGVMGTKTRGNSWRQEPTSGHWTLNIFALVNSIEEAEKYKSHGSTIRARALAKLTMEERKALGLT